MQTMPPVLAAVLIMLSFSIGFPVGADTPMLVPEIEGDWWVVARDPDLGPLTDPKQQPVDFAIWQAADGTWQLWSCIRNTRCGGNGRLFYRWEGRHLTDADWTPMGIAMQADPAFGETPGGLQAPYVLRTGDVFSMFYGDWEHICLATSADGKTFTRRLNADGTAGMFTEGIGANTRDPMVLRIGDAYRGSCIAGMPWTLRWAPKEPRPEEFAGISGPPLIPQTPYYCYYTAFPNQQGAVYCRTSTDLRNWSDSTVVAFGGSAGTTPWSAECPFVVHHEPSAHFYLFRTQRYGADAQTSVYRSHDPLRFGINEDERYLVCRLPVAAPEIVWHGGEHYIAALLPELKGIRIARLSWRQR
jgi:hypothetical protein